MTPVGDTVSVVVVASAAAAAAPIATGVVAKPLGCDGYLGVNRGCYALTLALASGVESTGGLGDQVVVGGVGFFVG